MERIHEAVRACFCIAMTTKRENLCLLRHAMAAIRKCSIYHTNRAPIWLAVSNVFPRRTQMKDNTCNIQHTLHIANLFHPECASLHTQIVDPFTDYVYQIMSNVSPFRYLSVLATCSRLGSVHIIFLYCT